MPPAVIEREAIAGVAAATAALSHEICALCGGQGDPAATSDLPPAATNGYRLSSPTPQAYPGPPQLTEVPPVHALAMCQNRYKPKAARARKPSVGCIRPSLELCYCLRHCEAAAFQFDRYYPGYEVFFTYEQILTGSLVA